MARTNIDLHPTRIKFNVIFAILLEIWYSMLKREGLGKLWVWPIVISNLVAHSSNNSFIRKSIPRSRNNSKNIPAKPWKYRCSFLRIVHRVSAFPRNSWIIKWITWIIKNVTVERYDTANPQVKVSNRRLDEVVRWITGEKHNVKPCYLQRCYRWMFVVIIVPDVNCFVRKVVAINIVMCILFLCSFLSSLSVVFFSPLLLL